MDVRAFLLPIFSLVPSQGRRSQASDAREAASTCGFRWCPRQDTESMGTGPTRGFGSRTDRHGKLRGPERQGRPAPGAPRRSWPFFGSMMRSSSRVRFPSGEAKVTAYEHRRQGGEGLGCPALVGASLLTSASAGASTISPRFLHAGILPSFAGWTGSRLPPSVRRTDASQVRTVTLLAPAPTLMSYRPGLRPPGVRSSSRDEFHGRSGPT
jgi:hypothetical protein